MGKSLTFLDSTEQNKDGRERASDVSYITTAQEKIDEAKEQIGKAIKSISEIVINQCAGHDEFKGWYRRRLRFALERLLHIREDLD